MFVVQAGRAIDYKGREDYRVANMSVFLIPKHESNESNQVSNSYNKYYSSITAKNKWHYRNDIPKQ